LALKCHPPLRSPTASQERAAEEHPLTIPYSSLFWLNGGGELVNPQLDADSSAVEVFTTESPQDLSESHLRLSSSSSLEIIPLNSYLEVLDGFGSALLTVGN